MYALNDCLGILHGGPERQPNQRRHRQRVVEGHGSWARDGICGQRLYYFQAVNSLSYTMMSTLHFLGIRVSVFLWVTGGWVLS